MKRSSANYEPENPKKQILTQRDPRNRNNYVIHEPSHKKTPELKSILRPNHSRPKSSISYNNSSNRIESEAISEAQSNNKSINRPSSSQTTPIPRQATEIQPPLNSKNSKNMASYSGRNVKHNYKDKESSSESQQSKVYSANPYLDSHEKNYDPRYRASNSSGHSYHTTNSVNRHKIDKNENVILGQVQANNNYWGLRGVLVLDSNF